MTTGSWNAYVVCSFDLTAACSVRTRSLLVDLNADERSAQGHRVGVRAKTHLQSEQVVVAHIRVQLPH